MSTKTNKACIKQVWNNTEVAEYPSITLDIQNMKSLLFQNGYGCKLDEFYPSASVRRRANFT